MPIFHKPIPHAIGTITGKIVDSYNHPIANEQIFAMDTHGLTNYPFILAKTRSRADGSFTIIAKKCVDTFGIRGKYQIGVFQNGNLIRVMPNSR